MKAAEFADADGDTQRARARTPQIKFLAAVSPGRLKIPGGRDGARDADPHGCAGFDGPMRTSPGEQRSRLGLDQDRRGLCSSRSVTLLFQNPDRLSNSV